MSTTNLFFAFIFLSSLAQASIPAKSELDLGAAYDVLSMPASNQQQVSKGQKADQLYPALIHISRSASESMQTRWRALTLASSLKPEQVLPELELALVAPDWFLRNAALLLLQRYHPARAHGAAQVLLKDKALVVRSAAVQVLGERMDNKTRDLFWEELSSSKNFRRKQSLWIRGQMISRLADRPEAHETGLFVKLLSDLDARVQASAVVAMEKLTKTTLGKAGIPLKEKSELWVQWAKARPSGTL